MHWTNPMVLRDPWEKSYLNNCKVPPKFDQQTMPTKPLLSLNLTPISDNKTLITIYLKIICLCDDDNDDKLVPHFMYFSSTSKANIKNNKQENLHKSDLYTVNKFMMTSAITKPTPLPQHSTSLRGKKIGMPNFIRLTDNF